MKDESREIYLLQLWMYRVPGDTEWTKDFTRKDWRFLRGLGCTRRRLRRENKLYKKQPAENYPLTAAHRRGDNRSEVI